MSNDVLLIISHIDTMRDFTDLLLEILIFWPKNHFSAQEGRRDFVLGTNEAELASLLVTCE